MEAYRNSDHYSDYLLEVTYRESHFYNGYGRDYEEINTTTYKLPKEFTIYDFTSDGKVRNTYLLDKYFYRADNGEPFTHDIKYEIIEGHLKQKKLVLT